MSLKTAYELIKAGRKEDATNLLVTMLREDDQNAQAWWLLSYVLEDPDEVREALEQVLALQPDHTQAQQRLANVNRYLAQRENRAPARAAKPAPEAPDYAQAPRRFTPLMMVLGAVGLLLIVGGVLFLVLRNSGVLPPAVPPTATPEPTPFLAGLVIPEDSIDRGPLARGDVRDGTVTADVDERWVFSGQAGERLAILVFSLDEVLDPKLFLYDPSGTLIANNDDIDYSREDFNARIDIELPVTGDYTLVVRAFDEGGDYQIILN